MSIQVLFILKHCNPAAIASTTRKLKAKILLFGHTNEAWKIMKGDNLSSLRRLLFSTLLSSALLYSSPSLLSQSTVLFSSILISSLLFITQPNQQ